MIVVPVERRIDWSRPPIVLIALVVVNLLVFVFYQSGDNEVVEQAVDVYQFNKLLEVELPAYRAYLKKVAPNEELDVTDPNLVWYMVTDTNFSKFLNDHNRRYIRASQRTKWVRARAKVDELTGKISSNALGLDAFDIGVVTLFSHQFLHGDIFHLLGNIVFLVLTGFAVEAALGSRKFLAYYLISGVGAGLLFALYRVASGEPSGSLIGASGAISGVMAMYVVLYGTRKIEFFYWLFVLTGYFRAAAIIMLPAYILKELYFLLFTDGSNVAYTAHIGGFITGAVLVYITKSLLSKTIDEDYLEGPVVMRDPHLEKLQSLYSQMGQGDFNRSWEMLKSLKKSRPNDSELIEIEFNLVRALQADRADEYLIRRLGKRGNNRNILVAQSSLWRRMNKEQQANLSPTQKYALIDALLEIEQAEAIEKIYQSLESVKGNEQELATVARKISNYYKGRGDHNKSTAYDQHARDFMNASFALPASEGER